MYRSAADSKNVEAMVCLHVVRVRVMVASTSVQSFVRLRSVCCITLETWACCRTTR
jgi:hypothetical protein